MTQTGAKGTPTILPRSSTYEESAAVSYAPVAEPPQTPYSGDDYDAPLSEAPMASPSPPQYPDYDYDAPLSFAPVSQPPLYVPRARTFVSIAPRPDPLAAPVSTAPATTASYSSPRSAVTWPEEPVSTYPAVENVPAQSQPQPDGVVEVADVGYPVLKDELVRWLAAGANFNFFSIGHLKSQILHDFEEELNEIGTIALTETGEEKMLRF
ncbi:hypothetical protein G7054_g7157 [Neopestalotiopsis clavispora]|nr:hypothetical protein G7054_g7157 [Neopestalotiopsis clavispora]